MNMQAKSLLKKVFIYFATSLVLFVVQMESDSIVVDVLCKIANALLTIWTVWLLIKFTCLAISGIWHGLIAKVKAFFSRKTVIKPAEISIKPIALKVQKKARQPLYEENYEDTYQYGR